MRPLAAPLGVSWLVANRLEFRHGVATGRRLEPVTRPRGLFARITGSGPDGERDAEAIARELDLEGANVRSAVVPAERRVPVLERPIVYFDGQLRLERFL